jgi:fumarylacetoacetase
MASASVLPYGVFSVGGEAPRVGVALGDRVLDLAGALEDEVFLAPSLNGFLAQGRPAWDRTAARLGQVLTDSGLVEAHAVPVGDATLHLPFEVADYVDFYSSLEHATNAGRILRPGEEPLKPNWRHLPVGYHGRSGTVVVSATPVRRPWGQRISGAGPVFAPTERLDFEAEVGFVVGAGSELGRPVPMSAFREHVFGTVLVIDWSARDIQAWEYVPLGPFLGKSFATSISPWVVPLDGLAAARVAPVEQDPPPLPYLASPSWALDLRLEVRLNGQVVSRPGFRSMYWTADQQLAHLTSNGASVRTGDLYASGTVSDASECGSLLELTANGQRPLLLGDGSSRGYLEDGDTVTITATAGSAGSAVDAGFGAVSGTVLPA